MAWTKVSKYALGYSLSGRQFYFYYWLEGETVSHQIFPSPNEFLALSDMFRNEAPVNFNSDGNYFVTGEESVGEGEA
jgi:hypothetical protein